MTSKPIIFQSQSIAERLRQPYPHTGPALALALIMPGYHVIVAINRGRTAFMPELALDRAIPVDPVWMLAYGSVWIFAFLPVFVVRQPALTRRAMLAFLTVFGAAYVGFLAYPTVLPRAETVGEGFFATSLEVVYSLDPPYNCFPSLHVAWAFVAALTCYRVHRGVGIVALFWAAIIGVSTLYTKQHYVVDVIAGIIIAYAAYLLFLRGYPRAAIAEADRRLAPRRAFRAVWLYSGIVAFLWAYRFTVAS
ncbi:MAG TPA: phosphatase PAP2 family protein [Gemmatimonadaceae bacterium]|nr:phosphatase PAP2 family protein [Gemmatimonadaceae bacterium]